VGKKVLGGGGEEEDKDLFRKKDKKTALLPGKNSSYTVLVSLGDGTSLILEPFLCFVEYMTF